MNSELLSDRVKLLDDEEVDATVLVVDDEPNIVTLLQSWLETIGCRVHSASDGESGVEKAKELHPDLILMDGMMPKMSGFEACRLLKTHESTRDIPVIFLTVQSEVKDVVKGLELGAHGYMTKPFKPQELLARVRSTLKIKQIQDRLKYHTQKLRNRWNWMHGVVESLPFGLMVFDPESGQVIYANERLTEYLGLEEWTGEASELQDELSFIHDGKNDPTVWDLSDDVDQTYSVKFTNQDRGEFRVRASTFEKNNRRGRQILLERL